MGFVGLLSTQRLMVDGRVLQLLSESKNRNWSFFPFMDVVVDASCPLAPMHVHT